MKKTRLLLLFLCFCLIIPCFAACAEPDDDDDDDDYMFIYDDASRETAADLVYTLNPDGYSLGGQKIGILYGGHFEKMVIGDGETTDIVYTRIYERNKKVEARLKCKLQFNNSGTTLWDEYAVYLQTVFNTYDTTSEIITSTNNCVIQEKHFGKFQNLNDSNYIDINERWWYTDAIMELSLDDYHYRFLYGDILIGALSSAGAIFYNKELYSSLLRPGHDEDELYQKVLDGEWTLEALRILTNESSFNETIPDRMIKGFSLFRYAEPIHYFAAGCGTEYYVRDINGFPKITINNQRSIDFVKALYNFIYNNEGAWLFYPNQVGDEVAHEDDFPNRKVIFLFETLSACLKTNMREMEDDFGILPYPKWDKDQEQYINFIANGSTLVGIPVMVNYDRAMEEISAVIEAMASEAYRSVALAFYESALQTAYVRDDYASQMIDIITGNHATVKSVLKTNMLYEFGSSCNYVGAIFSNVMKQGQGINPEAVFTNNYKQIEISAPNNLRDLVDEWIASGN